MKNKLKRISLENRYIPALLLIAIFTFFAYQNFESMTESIQNDGNNINKSGRQRMLSQRLIVLGTQYLSFAYDYEKDREKLKELINLMKRSHTELMANVKNEELNKIYYEKGLDSLVQNYLKDFEGFLQSRNPQTLYNLGMDSKYLLPLLSSAVEEYEKMDKLKVARLEQKQFYIFIATLLFLILEMIFIFYPASKQIKNHRNELENAILLRTKELQESLNIISKNVIYSRTDLKGFITDVSEAFCEISGYTKDEMIGKSHNIIRHPDSSSTLFKELWDAIKTEEIWKGEIKNLRKDGTFYWVKITISPEYNDDGILISYLALREDITAKKALNKLNEDLSLKVKKEVEKNREKDKQLIQQSRLAQMGEMISMIAHQWRQPLSAITATSSLIELKAKLNQLDTAVTQQKAKDISNYAQHLSTTINDFRDFFKPNKELQETSYDEVVKSVLVIVETSITNQNIKLLQVLNCHNRFSTYLNELRQVLLNLIKNAEDVLLENEIENSYIQISTYTEDENYILEVSDNGGGIPEEIMEKIFDPYFSTKSEKNGTGLGLYMSKTIIEEHCGGTLSIANSSEGAVFKIMLGKSV